MRLAYLMLLLGLLAMTGLVLAQTQPANALQNDCRYVKCGVNPFSRVPTTEAQAVCLRANCSHCPTILGGSCPVNPPQTTPPTTPSTPTPPQTPNTPVESPLYRCYREQCHVNPYSAAPWSQEQWNCIRQNCQNLPPQPSPAPSPAGTSLTQLQCYLACEKKARVQTKWRLSFIDPEAYKNCTAACGGDPLLGACTAGTRKQVTSLESYACNESGKWVRVNTTQSPVPSCTPVPFPRQPPASAATGRAAETTPGGGSGFLQWISGLFGR